MSLACYLTLDQSVLFNGDYSSDSSLKLTGTVYSDINKTTAFNLTGYTITLRIYKENTISDNFNQECTITVAASGTWYISVASATMPSAGLYQVKIELTKSGTIVSSLNRTELLIKRGPTA
jgi:hypothetical protein